MPEMINLETAGYRRSPRFIEQPRKKYTFSSLARFCAFGMLCLSAFSIISQPTVVFSHAHACVNSVVYKCNIIDSNFDGTINAIHHMVLASGKTNNEVYTFREMTQQDDAYEFIAAMQKEIAAHEERGHWEVVSRSSIPLHTRIIQAI